MIDYEKLKIGSIIRLSRFQHCHQVVSLDFTYKVFVVIAGTETKTNNTGLYTYNTVLKDYYINNMKDLTKRYPDLINLDPCYKFQHHLYFAHSNIIKEIIL